MLAILNPLALAMHGGCDIYEKLRQRTREKLGTRIGILERLRWIIVYLIIPSWTSLMNTVVTGLPPPRTAGPGPR